MLCTIWYDLYNFKSAENTHRGVLFIIVQMVSNRAKHHILADLGVCSSDKIIPKYFLRLCKVWSILHHMSVGRVHNKNVI